MWNYFLRSILMGFARGGEALLSAFHVSSRSVLFIFHFCIDTGGEVPLSIKEIIPSSQPFFSFSVVFNTLCAVQELSRKYIIDFVHFSFFRSLIAHSKKKYIYISSRGVFSFCLVGEQPQLFRRAGAFFSVVIFYPGDECGLTMLGLACYYI